VSRVFTDTGAVSPKARVKVLAAAKKLGYRPNTAARTLVMGRSKTIGALIRQVTDPGYSHLIVGLQERAAHYGYRILTVTGNLDTESELDGLETLLSLQVEGLVIGSGRLESSEIASVARRAATVVCWRDVPEVDVVRVDESASAATLIRHLAALGHRDIALLEAEHHNATARIRAIRAAAAKHGVTLRRVPAGYLREECEEATTALIRHQPLVTAVVGLSGWAGVGALSALQDAGLAVPGDVSVACYNAVVFDQIPQLGLTNMRQSNENIAAIAIDTIIERLANPSKPRSRHLVRADLVAGRTTGPVRR
jgi:DNA-binding LacI/PurR family transcriptional regulator